MFSISYTVYDPDGVSQATGSITPPTSYPATATEGTYANEATLTSTSTPAQVEVGGTVRVLDTWGQVFDCNVYGKKSKSVRVSDFGGAATEVTSFYNPVVSIPVSSAVLDDTGNGWRADLTWVSGGATYRDTLYFSVCLVSLNLTISPREYLDYHPEAATDLAALERRKDWPRLVRAATTLVEERLRSMDRWYSAIVSPSGLRRCVAEALHVLLAPSSVPEGYKTNPADWTGRAEKRFNGAIADAMAGAYYDEDQDGTVSEEEKLAPAGVSYKVL